MMNKILLGILCGFAGFALGFWGQYEILEKTNTLIEFSEPLVLPMS